jgi:MFS family permease
MRVESRIFLGMAAFLFACAVVYAGWTWAENNHHPEVIGVTALVLSGGLCLIVGSYFSFVARRIDLRPEDRGEADIAEGAGELGFFSPGSYWPIGVALAAAIGGIAVAFWEVWLLIIGIVGILLTVGGLLFEYYTRGHTSPTL